MKPTPRHQPNIQNPPNRRSIKLNPNSKNKEIPVKKSQSGSPKFAQKQTVRHIKSPKKTKKSLLNKDRSKKNQKKTTPLNQKPK